MVRYLYNLWGDPPISLAPTWSCTVITILWLYCLCCTLHPHDCLVTTDLYFLIPSPFHLAPQTLSHRTTIHLFSVSMSLFLCCLFILFFKFHIHMSEILWYLSFSAWLTSLSIIPSQSIHVVANDKISFFFMAEWYSIIYTYHISFILFLICRASLHCTVFDQQLGARGCKRPSYAILYREFEHPQILLFIGGLRTNHSRILRNN